MDDLINDFIAETRDMLQALAGAIVAWETEPDDRARLDEIFRFVHTVKGNCGFFDLPRLELLSHAAEDALAEVRTGKRAPDARLVSAVLAVIDRIGELVQALETGEALASADDEQLIAALTTGSGPAAVAAVEPTAVPANDNRRGMRSIRLSVDLLDRIMNGVSDAVLARNELARSLRDYSTDISVDAAFDRVSACIAEIRDAITRTRMQRIDSLFAALPRMVRDLAGELGKQVRLEVDGGDVEMDREMIEMIRDPLTHIVRNAVDHGIEPPSDREGAGKPASGLLKVSARQSGNQILIEICDDGRGIDADKLARKAVAAGLITQAQAESLSAPQRTALMFEAGLSTAGQVTAISGRGVGMDVVRANIERIGGLVDVDSRLGHGLRLTIRVPLTLTIIPALTVGAGGQIFAIPRAAIEEILRASGASVRIETVGEAQVCSIRGRRVPLVSLAKLLGDNAASQVAEQTLVLLKPAGGDLYALAVDLVHDHEELVVKPAAPAIMAAGLYAGTTLADDGRPILLLDPSGLASRAGLRFDAADVERRLGGASGGAAVKPPTDYLLVRGLDKGALAVRLTVVERIEDVPASAVRRSGGRFRVALGENLVPLLGCEQPPSTDRMRLLRLTDGATELAYAFADTADIISFSGDIRPAATPGEIAGVALIEGEQVEILDPYWLFAAMSEHASAPERPLVCALPPGDSWMDTFLRPIVESLGYRVAPADGSEQPDVVIASDSSADTPDGARVLRLRATPEESQDGSIYRYDRLALLAALSRASAGGTAR